MKKTSIIIIGLFLCNIAMSQNTKRVANSDSMASSNIVVDIDGNRYHTIKIGKQVWMMENLKTTRYQNGDTIGTKSGDISAEKAPEYQWVYSGNDTNLIVYGRLYTWYTVVDKRNVCPVGWHVPANTEWRIMTTYIHGKFKSLEDSGFPIIKGGRRDSEGSFNDIDMDGGWWGTNVNPALKDCGGGLYFNGDQVYVGFGVKNTGFSVRCLKNTKK
jgi:uncharacterized protein (TIGR02145 family)